MWRRLWWTGGWMPIAVFTALLAGYVALLGGFPGAAPQLFEIFQVGAILCAVSFAGVFVARSAFGRFGRLRALAERAEELFDELRSCLARRGKLSEGMASTLESLGAQLTQALESEDEAAIASANQALAEQLSNCRSAWGVIRSVAERFILVILIASLMRLFVVEPFTIPSDSMAPTLLVGDQALVIKLAYGLRLPWKVSAPSWNWSQPERGDVIVFDMPGGEGQTFIKRVIGLPGDQIELHRGQVFVNGTPLPHFKLRDDFAYWNQGESRSWYEQGPVFLFEERTDSRVWNTTDQLPPQERRHQGPYRVPEGQFFVLGDNRANSSDSRSGLGRRANKVAYVPISQVKGRAMILWLSLGFDGWGGQHLGNYGLRLRRFFKPIS